MGEVERAEAEFMLRPPAELAAGQQNSEAEKQEHNKDDTIHRPKLSERLITIERKTMKTQIVARADFSRRASLRWNLSRPEGL